MDRYKRGNMHCPFFTFKTNVRNHILTDQITGKGFRILKYFELDRIVKLVFILLFGVIYKLNRSIVTTMVQSHNQHLWSYARLIRKKTGLNSNLTAT